MVNYKLHFNSGLSIDFGSKACYLFMKNFNKSLQWEYNIDYDDEGSVKVKSFESYKLQIKKDSEAHKHYVEYLYNKYKSHITNVSALNIINDNSVTIKSSTSARKAHVIMAWFRFFREGSRVIDKFFTLKDCKNQDLAFLTAVSHTKGSNHSPVRDMTWAAIDQFMSDKPIAGDFSLKKDPSYDGVAKYFSGTNSENAGNVFSKLGYIGDDTLNGYKDLESMYEKHCGIVAKKLRKTVPKGGLQRPYGIPPGRPYKWEYTVFAAA